MVAFSNTLGGIIIIGVDDKTDEASISEYAFYFSAPTAVN